MTKKVDKLTKAEVMALTGLGDSTIWRYVDLGVFPPKKWGNSHSTRWDRADIDLWIKANGTGPLRSSTGPQETWRTWLDIQTDPRLSAPDREQVVDISKSVAEYIDELNSKHDQPGEKNPLPGKTDVKTSSEGVTVKAYVRKAPNTVKVKPIAVNKGADARYTKDSTPRLSTYRKGGHDDYHVYINKTLAHVMVLVVAIAAAWFVGKTY